MTSFQDAIRRGHVRPGDVVTVSHALPYTARRVVLSGVQFKEANDAGAWVSSSWGSEWVSFRLRWELHDEAAALI
jgi:hypothetical protein